MQLNANSSEVEEEVCAVCPKMTYQQRIGGCASFMVLGFFLSLGSLTRCAINIPDSLAYQHCDI